MRIVDEETERKEREALKAAPEASASEMVHRPESEHNRMLMWILIMIPSVALVLIILAVIFGRLSWNSEVSDLLSAEVGNTIEFGNISDGSEAMCTWTVLKKEDDRILVVCNNYIGEVIVEELEDGSQAVLGEDSWETTACMEYLNGEFYENVFDKKEKKLILQVTLEPETSESGFSSGNATADRLFLLSAEEITDPEISAAWNTLLRTPGEENPLYMGKGETEEISVGTYYYKPAMWLDLSSVK